MPYPQGINGASLLPFRYTYTGLLELHDVSQAHPVNSLLPGRLLVHTYALPADAMGETFRFLGTSRRRRSDTVLILHDMRDFLHVPGTYDRYKSPVHP
jgi:hypothetical protein